MPTRLAQVPTVLLATMLMGGGLLSACSSQSAPDPAPDSTATSSIATTVSDSSSSVPSAPPTLERNDDRTLDEKLTDASLETKVKRAFVRESSLRTFPLHPTVVNGHLILRGDVNTPDQYNRAERIGKQVEGVTAVTNRLTMGGQSVTEDRLAENGDESDGKSGENSAVYHTVQQGDTFWSIAHQYRASIEQIRSLNDLRSDNLNPGQRVRVR